MTTNHFRALARDYRALADHYDAMADATDAAMAAAMAQAQAAVPVPPPMLNTERIVEVHGVRVDQPPRVYVAADPDIVAEATGEQRERIATRWPDAVTADELQRLKPAILAKVRAEKSAANGNGSSNGNGSGRRSDPPTAAAATKPRIRLPGDPP